MSMIGAAPHRYSPLGAGDLTNSLETVWPEFGAWLLVDPQFGVACLAKPGERGRFAEEVGLAFCGTSYHQRYWEELADRGALLKAASDADLYTHMAQSAAMDTAALIAQVGPVFAGDHRAFIAASAAACAHAHRRGPRAAGDITNWQQLRAHRNAQAAKLIDLIWSAV